LALKAEKAPKGANTVPVLSQFCQSDGKMKRVLE